MKLGVFTPVFGTMKLDEILVKVRGLKHVQALEIGTGGWPGSDHIDLPALLDNKSCVSEVGASRGAARSAGGRHLLRLPR